MPIRPVNTVAAFALAETITNRTTCILNLANGPANRPIFDIGRQPTPIQNFHTADLFLGKGHAARFNSFIIPPHDQRYPVGILGLEHGGQE
jgi:hypothetical protein